MQEIYDNLSNGDFQTIALCLFPFWIAAMVWIFCGSKEDDVE